MFQSYLRKLLESDLFGVFFLFSSILGFCYYFSISGNIFFDGDAWSYFYPYTSIFNTHVGIWNSGILGGFPLAASFQFGFFSPLYRLIFSFGDYLFSYSLLISLYFVVAGGLTYLYSRKIGLSVAGAILSASAYSLAQFNTHWAGNMAVIGGMVVLPAAFLGVWASFFGNKKYVVLLSLILGVSFLSVHQQFVLLALFASGIYGLYNSWNVFKVTKAWKNVFLPWLYLAGAFIVSLAIGYRQILYTLKFAGFSGRAGGLDYAHAAVNASTPLDYIKYVLPNFGFRYGVSQEFLPFIGVVAFVLALFAIWKLFKTNNHVRFFSGMYLFILLVAVKYSPIFFIFTKTPILSYFRGPARWIFVGNFVLAMIAGFGLDHVANKPELRQKIARIFCWISGVVVACGLIATTIYYSWGLRIISKIQNLFDVYYYHKTTGLPLDYYHKIISDIVSFSFFNFSFYNKLFLVPVLFLICAIIIFKYVKSTEKFILIILILSSLSLIWSGRNSFTVSQPELLNKQPEIAQVIHGREGVSSEFRVFSFLVSMASSQKISEVYPNSNKEGLEYALNGFFGNSNLLWNLQVIDGYEPMSTERSQRTTGFIGSEDNQSSSPLAGSAIPLQDKIKLFSSRLPLLSMLNVKYIVSAYELPSSSNLVLIHTALVTRFKIP
ncbi:MAG: hypothetical protein KBC81_03310, partial [Candidatus Pacebacteria bacterium]|nr:hypothetical protein [Candidatus Paceibacterota bacterium]